MIPKIIFLFASIIPIYSYYYEYSENVQLRSISEWDTFINRQLSNLTKAKVMTNDQAMNILRTFDIHGVGEFRSPEEAKSGTKFTSGTYDEIYEGKGGAKLAQSIAQLIRDRENCTRCQKEQNNRMMSCDPSRALAEALAKAAVRSNSMTTKNVADLAEDTGIAVYVPPEDGPDNCYQEHMDLKALCENEKKGVADGLRCLFLSDATGAWSDGWPRCQTKNATVAPVVTGSEQKKFYAQITKAGASYAWSSYKRKDANYGPHPSFAKCTTPVNATNFYDSATSPNQMLVHNNTFWRNQACVTSDARDDECLLISPSWTNLADNPCGNGFKHTCQMTNPGQKYVRINYMCLNEQPITESAGDAPEDCAGFCGSPKNPWCRSFNHYKGKCQFFPWHADDAPVMTANLEGCTHYAYLV